MGIKSLEVFVWCPHAMGRGWPRVKFVDMLEVTLSVLSRADAALLSSRPELSARLAAARIQGLGKQLADCRVALQQQSKKACVAAHEAAQLKKERVALQQHAASLTAQVLHLRQSPDFSASFQQCLGPDPSQGLAPAFTYCFHTTYQPHGQPQP